MSDTFDHEGDAWNSSIDEEDRRDYWGDDDGHYDYVPRQRKTRPNAFVRDWTCHRVTDKAYQISGIMKTKNNTIELKSRWMPKKYVTHSKTTGHLIIDGWLVNQIEQEF